MSTNPDPRGLLLGQLQIIRAQVDLAIALLDEAAGQAGCPHPEEARLDTSTGGRPPSFYCKACDQEIVGA